MPGPVEITKVDTDRDRKGRTRRIAELENTVAAMGQDLIYMANCNAQLQSVICALIRLERSSSIIIGGIESLHKAQDEKYLDDFLKAITANERG